MEPWTMYPTKAKHNVRWSTIVEKHTWDDGTTWKPKDPYVNLMKHYMTKDSSYYNYGTRQRRASIRWWTKGKDH